MLEQKGIFQDTIPCNYGQPSSSEAMSPEPLRHYFQWSGDEKEASGYTSSAYHIDRGSCEVRYLHCLLLSGVGLLKSLD